MHNALVLASCLTAQAATFAAFLLMQFIGQLCGCTVSPPPAQEPCRGVCSEGTDDDKGELPLRLITNIVLSA